VPLIAITAVRPKVHIDQWDGQTIRQEGIFEKHILERIQWPADLNNPEQIGRIDSIMQKAMEAATGFCKGPVHINIPLRDPIYRDFDSDAPLVQTPQYTRKAPSLPEIIIPELTGRTLLICGMNPPDDALKEAIIRVSKKIPVLCDIASGLMEYSTHPHWERALTMSGGNIPEYLQADQLISIGTSMLSKPLKQWLRKHKPKRHFHIAAGGWVGDPFDTHPRHLTQHPASFLELLEATLSVDNNYACAWKEWCEDSEDRYRQQKSKLPWSEWAALEFIFSNMPKGITLQLGNSMPVRYAAWLSPLNTKAVFANRGSSGIDGCVSTALGYALAHPEELVLLLVGDMSFFYDSNALWIDRKPENLRIIVLNNGGGNIFRIIDGPHQLKVTSKFLVMEDQRSSIELAASLQCSARSYHELPDIHEINSFFTQPGPALMELLFPEDSGPRVLEMIKGA
jgi:2-succinyl-5-enolpyruvyl-6-hydroxy-3-cyclohexene-1-carboxylate synthase